MSQKRLRDMDLDEALDVTDEIRRVLDDARYPERLKVWMVHRLVSKVDVSE